MAWCENCERETEFLFKGIVITKATQYGFKGQSKKLVALGPVEIPREGMVCFRCRPPSNLEIEEILSDGRQEKRSVPKNS